MTQIKKLAKKINLIVTDVDGVLTDGGRYYSKDGEILKKFHVRDGMSVNILLRNKIKTIILTKEKSPITQKWAKDIICKKYKTNLENIAYIGDDVNDLIALKKVGLSAVPNDAVFQVKKIANYICKNKSGNACFREFADLILLSKFSSKTKWY